jgi:hypothetical protein
MRKLYIILVFAGLYFSHHQASGQLLNKMKQKLEDKAEQAVDKAINGGNKTNSTLPSGSPNAAGTPTGTGSSASSRRAVNKGGEGLISTPPDVKQNLTEAETYFKSGKFSETRQAVQQAMLGVEMEIGQKILKSLPESISGLRKKAEADQVTSSGWGWAGLNILRQYDNNDDKELRVTVANNAALMTAVNLYFANSQAQSTGGQQNWKQTTVKGNRAILEYDADSGYKLTVPFGQASLLVYEAVNFKDEKEMMAAANAVDIDHIKKMLGEK